MYYLLLLNGNVNLCGFFSPWHEFKYVKKNSNSISRCVKIWKCTEEYISNNNPHRLTAFPLFWNFPCLQLFLFTLVNHDQMTLSIAPTHIVVSDNFYPYSRQILSSLNLNSQKGEVLTLHILSSTTTHTKVSKVCYHVTL